MNNNIKTKYSAIQSKIKGVSRHMHNKLTKNVKICRQLAIFKTHHGQIIL